MPEQVTVAAVASATAGSVRGEATTHVAGVTHDSRQVRPGMLFAAVRGFEADGHDFIAEALAAGAASVVVEDLDGVPPGITAIVIPDVRSQLGRIAATVYGDPSQRLRLVGITGTNGKTTVAHLLESICAAAGIPQAIVGTVGARINGEAVPVVRTTPEATDFQRLLADMAGAGVDVAAVEVSSHALALGRVAATEFTVAAFTNLSQDHLDFHSDMEEYFRVKASLFDGARHGVIWVDDVAGARIAAAASIPVTTVGMGTADVRGEPVTVGLDGSVVHAAGAGGGARIHLRLAGRFNMQNALIAAACANALGIPWDTIADGIGQVDSIPGRFEIVRTRKDCTVVVDYAHTPEGVEAMIAAARELTAGRVIAVVGAGGDRDRDKRPMMGAAAATADLAVITTDNPRSEDPESIAVEVAAGAGGGAEVVVDRRDAIGTAIERARSDDVVLILGKGHERTQEVAGGLRPFDDRQVAREEAAR